MLRGRWGIQKDRGNGDLHHCIDAVVIAATSPSLIQRLSAYYKEKEQRFAGKDYAVNPSTGEMLTHREYERQFAPEFPTPWQRFREELNARLNPIAPAEAIAQLQLSTYASDEEIKPVFVSHMPNHTVTGAAHEETIRSGIVPGHTITKTALTDLKLENGQIEGYYQPETDPLLYNALLARLQQYGGDGKKAFAEPFFKPKRDGTPGPRVDKVKICKKSALNTPTGRGVADNGRMVRIDVYLVPDDGYYFIPIYVADTKKKALPDKAVVAHKSAADWKPMDDRNFLFSLFRDDLIWINCRKPITLSLSKDASGEKTITTKSGFFYYGGANMTKPLQKQLWQDIVVRKILNQAACLRILNRPGADELAALAASVRSGDPDNREAVAAAVYFPALFGVGFSRDQDCLQNAALNYGYAIIRGGIARNLVIHGLEPCLGLHHRSERNNFNLADDMIEPFRPLVDLFVASHFQGDGELSTTQKQNLFNLTSFLIRQSGRKYQVMTAIGRCCASLAECVQSQHRNLELPELIALEQRSNE